MTENLLINQNVLQCAHECGVDRYVAHFPYMSVYIYMSTYIYLYVYVYMSITHTHTHTHAHIRITGFTRVGPWIPSLANRNLNRT
jgi:hypothetical protein